MTNSSGHAILKNIVSTLTQQHTDMTLILCRQSTNLVWLWSPHTKSYEFCQLSLFSCVFIQSINGSSLVPRSVWREWLPAYYRLITPSWLYEYSDYFYETNLKVLKVATAILCRRRLIPLRRHQGAFYTVLKHRRKTMPTRISRQEQQLTSYCSFVDYHKRNTSLARHIWSATSCR